MGTKQIKYEIGANGIEIAKAIAEKAETLLKLNDQDRIGDRFLWNTSGKSKLVIDMDSDLFGAYSACAEISRVNGGLMIATKQMNWPNTELRGKVVLETDISGEIKTFEPGQWVRTFIQQAEAIQNNERDALESALRGKVNLLMKDLQRQDNEKIRR